MKLASTLPLGFGACALTLVALVIARTVGGPGEEAPATPAQTVKVGVAQPEIVASPAPTVSSTAAATPVPPPVISNSSHMRVTRLGLTSEFMAGKIVYSVVFVESNADPGNCSPADADLETWDAQRMDFALSEIADGVQFWMTREGRPSELSFVLENWGVRGTSCEPIARAATGGPAGEGKWMADVLAALGTPTTPDRYLDAATDFAVNRRNANRAGSAFTIFVVDSLNDADGCFAGVDCSDGCLVGELCLSAYAQINGPYMVLTWDNGNWGPDLMNLIVAHEVGHVFGAGDEYATRPGEPDCSTTETRGYLNVPNSSCNNGPNGDTSDISIMGGFEEATNPNVDVSRSARDAIGWRNPYSGEGGKTVVDVVKGVSVNYQWVGVGQDATPCSFGFASATSFPPGGTNTNGLSHRPQRIATLARIEWNVDGGPFLQAFPRDGSVDEDGEAFGFAPLTPLGAGKHTFGVRAVNSFGAVSDIVYQSVYVRPNASAGSQSPDVYLNVGECRATPVS